MTWPAEQPKETAPGTWLLRGAPASTEPPHQCAPPTWEEDYNVHPDGEPGDLWRCNTCGQVWLIKRTRGGLSWRAISERRATRLLMR